MVKSNASPKKITNQDVSNVLDLKKKLEEKGDTELLRRIFDNFKFLI